MEIKDRIAAMTADLGALTFGQLVRFGADAGQRHAHGFTVYRDGERLAEVFVRPDGDQEQVDRFALVLFHLLSGSESRVADAETRVKRLLWACELKDREIGRLRVKLELFEQGRAARGSLYAVEAPDGRVWLAGKPDAGSFAFCFASWHELATEYPGLRPCGVVQADATYVVMRPVADLAPPAATKEEDGHGA